MLNIYVASKFENKEPVRELISKLEDLHNHRITFDWTRDETVDGLQGKKLAAKLRRIAEIEVQAVRDCDILIMLARPDMKGAYTELGIAIGLNKIIILVDEEKFVNIFFNLPGIFHAENTEHVLEIVKSIHSGYP